MRYEQQIKSMRLSLGAVALGAAVILNSALSQAQEFPIPGKPIVMVVAAGAGGGTDTIARLLAEEVSNDINHPVIVENRAGGGQRTGTAYVAKSEPDGHTLWIGGTTALSVNPAIYGSELEYSVLDDFEPLGMVYTTSNVLVINPTIPATTIEEFKAYVRENPGEINYGATGVGSFAHLSTEYFNLRAGLDMTHIPYKGEAEELVALMANEVQFASVSITAALPHIKEGKIRALATTGAERHDALPDVPTVAEQGIEGFEMPAHVVVVVPKATPADRVEFLRQAFDKARKSERVQKFFQNIGAVQPETMNAADYIEFHKADVERFQVAAERLGLRKD